MLLAVRFYSQNPDNPGYPPMYPWKCREVEDVTNLQEGETALTVEQLEQTKQDLADEVTAFFESQNNAALLAETKQRIKDQITTLREQHEYAGFTWNGHHFQSDRDSQNRIHVAFSAAREGFSNGVTWRTTDNQFVQLTAPETVQMALTLMTRVEAIWQASFIHKNAVEALETVEEVESYDYTAGWPE